MGQQPNIELDLDDLPRPSHEPGAPVGWKPTRPGEITSPAQMPVGGVFGNPSPDTGWVKKLVAGVEFDRTAANAAEVVATIASVRASTFGRGPVPADVEAALIVLGLRDEGLDQATRDKLAELREEWFRAASHETVRGRSVLDVFEREFLHQSLDEIRAGVAEQLS